MLPIHPFTRAVPAEDFLRSFVELRPTWLSLLAVAVVAGPDRQDSAEPVAQVVQAENRVLLPRLALALTGAELRQQLVAHAVWAVAAQV